MLVKKKRTAIVEWINCFNVLDGPLESLQQLSNGRHFRKLINMIDPTDEDDPPDDTENYKLIENFLNGYFKIEAQSLVDFASCLEGQEFELAKTSILILSAVVQHSLTKEIGLVSCMTQLEEGIQEDIRDCIQAVVLPNGSKLTVEFSDVLSKRFPFGDSPVYQTPRRRTRRNTALNPVSPLVAFLDSPAFARQITIRNLESKVALLQRELDAEESKDTEREQHIDGIEKRLHDREKEIKELKKRIEESNSCRKSDEVSVSGLVESYKTEIERMKHQLKQCQKLEQELERLQKENVQLLNSSNSLRIKLENYEMLKSQVRELTAGLNQAKAAVESQKSIIEEMHTVNNSLKKSVEERETEMSRMHSLYDDAMREVRKLQNSPELPKGESMKVIVEMEKAELEKEIKVCQDKEIELKEHLKCSTVVNDRLQKDITVAEEKLTDERRETSRLSSCITVLKSEKHGLQEKCENILIEKNQLQQNLQACRNEMADLKTEYEQYCTEYKGNLLRLQEELAEATAKLKTCYENEKHNQTLLEQTASQKDALSRELHEALLKLRENEERLKTVVECKNKELAELNFKVVSTERKNSDLEKKSQKELAKLKTCYEKEKHDQTLLEQAASQKDALSHELHEALVKLRENEERLKTIVECKNKELAELNFKVVSTERKNSDLEKKSQEELAKATAKLKTCYEKEKHDQTLLEQAASQKDALSHELHEALVKLRENEERLKTIVECKNKELAELNFKVVSTERKNSDLEKKSQKELAKATAKLKTCYEKEKHDQTLLEQAASQKDALSHELHEALIKLRENEERLKTIVECKNKELAELNFKVVSTERKNSDLEKKSQEELAKATAKLKTCYEKEKHDQTLLEQAASQKDALSHELHEALVKLRENEERLKTIVECKNKELAELNFKVVSTERKNSDLEKKSQKELAEATAKLKTCYEKEKHDQTLLEQAASQKDALSHELHEALIKLRENEEKLKTIVECKNKELGELNFKVVSTEKENSDLEKKLQKLYDENGCQKQEYKQNLEALTTELEHLNNQLQQQSAEFAENKVKLTEELSHANSKLQDYCEKEEHSKSTLNQTISERDALSYEKDQMSIQLSEMEGRLNSLIKCKEEVDTLNSTVCAVQKENRSFLEKISKVTDENNRLKKAKEAVEKKLEMLAEDMKKSDVKKSKSLEAELSAKTSKLKYFDTEKLKVDSPNQLISNKKKYLPEESESYKIKYQKVEQRFSEHLGKCESDKAAVREALDKLYQDAQHQWDCSEVKNEELKKKLTESEQHLSALTMQKDEEVGNLSKQVQDLQKLQNQKDEAQAEEMKKLHDSLKRLQNESDTTESKMLIEVNNLNHCIEEKTRLIEKLDAEIKKARELKESQDAELRTVKKTCEEIEASHSKLISEISNLKQQKSELVDKLHLEHSEVENLQKSIGKLQNERDDMRVCICTHESEKEELEKNLNEAKQSISALMDTNKQKDESVDKLSRENEKLQALTQEARKLKASQDSELRTVKNTCEEIEASHSKLISEISNLKQQKSELVDKLHLELSKVENLQKSIGKLQNERDDMRVCICTHESEKEELEKNLNEAKQSISALMDTNKQKDESVDKLSRENEKLQALTQEARKLKESQDAELRTVKNTCEEIEASHSKLISEISNLKQQKSELVDKLHLELSEVENLQKFIGKLQNEKDDMRVCICTHESEKEELEKNLNKAKQSVNTLMDKNRQKDESIDKLSREIERLQSLTQEAKERRDAELRTAEKTLEEIETSHSKLISEISDLKREKSELVDKLHLEHSEVENLQKSIGKLQNEKHDMRMCIYTHESEKEELEKNLNEAKQSVNTLMDKNKQKDESIDELSEKIQKLQALTDECVNHKAEIERVQGLLCKAQEESKVLKAKYLMETQNLQCIVEAKENSLKHMTKTVQELEETSCKKDIDFQNFELNLKDLTLKNSELNKSLVIVSEEKKKNDENIDELTKQIQDLQGSLNRKDIDHETEMKTLKALLQKSLEEKKELESQYLIKEENLNWQHMKAIEKLSGEAQELEEKNKFRSIQKTFHEVETSKLSQAAEMRDLQNDLLRSRERTAYLESETERQSSYNQEKENEIKKLIKENEDLRNAIKNKENELEAVSNNLAESKDSEAIVSRLEGNSKIFQFQSKVGLQGEPSEKCVTVENLPSSEHNCSHSECSATIETLSSQLKECQTLYESTKQKYLEHLKACSLRDDDIQILQITLSKLTTERDDLQKKFEHLDTSKQEMMEKLEDSERRNDNLFKQKEIAESDYSLCVEKRDQDIYKLQRKIQELEMFLAEQNEAHKVKMEEIKDIQMSSESKVLTEVYNLNHCLLQKEKLIEENSKKFLLLEVMIKEKEDSLIKVTNTLKETDDIRHKLDFEIMRLNEDKRIDNEKIDRLNTECKRLSTKIQQQKKIIAGMKEIEQTLIESEQKSSAAVQKSLEEKKKNDQFVESLRKTVSKLKKENGELDKHILSCKQKHIGYQGVSQRYKQALAEEQKNLKLVKKDLENSQQLTDKLTKEVNHLQQLVQKYRQQVSCLENETRQARSELNEIRKNCDLDVYNPVARRLSLSATPTCSPSAKFFALAAEEQLSSPCGWRKPLAKKRMSNSSSTASFLSTNSDNLFSHLDATPGKVTGASNLFLPLAEEEDFLNYSSLADLKSGPHAVANTGTKRLSELQRRNTLCLPHMRTAYPVETQTRLETDFSEQNLKYGHAFEDKSKKNVLVERTRNANKVASPKRKRSSSDEVEKGRKVSKKSGKNGESSFSGFFSPRRTPTALKNLFTGNKRRNQDLFKKMKGKRF